MSSSPRTAAAASPDHGPSAERSIRGTGPGSSPAKYAAPASAARRATASAASPRTPMRRRTVSAPSRSPSSSRCRAYAANLSPSGGIAVTRRDSMRTDASGPSSTIRQGHGHETSEPVCTSHTGPAVVPPRTMSWA